MKISTMLINVRKELSLILIIILFSAISFPSIQSYYYKEKEDWKGIPDTWKNIPILEML